VFTWATITVLTRFTRFTVLARLRVLRRFLGREPQTLAFLLVEFLHRRPPR
jgi:hypothetical protein